MFLQEMSGMQSCNWKSSTDETPFRRGMYVCGGFAKMDRARTRVALCICRDMEPAKSADFVGPFLRSHAGLAVLLEVQ